MFLIGWNAEIFIFLALSVSWQIYAIYHKKYLINPLPDDKILAFPNLKAFADDKLNIAPIIDFLSFIGKKTW